MPTLKNWAPVASGDKETVLIGQIEGHPLFFDGRTVRTSVVMGKQGDLVITWSGSKYTLGIPADFKEEKTSEEVKTQFLADLKELPLDYQAPGTPGSVKIFDELA